MRTLARIIVILASAKRPGVRPRRIGVAALARNFASLKAVRRIPRSRTSDPCLFERPHPCARPADLEISDTVPTGRDRSEETCATEHFMETRFQTKPPQQ